MTAQVNEAYMRLVNYKRMRWQNRTHFFAISAQLMRRILAEHARRHSLKPGRGRQIVPLVEVASEGGGGLPDLEALDEAMTVLERLDARKARVVETRFFGGLIVEGMAGALKVSPVTVKREWRGAKAWL